MNRIRYSYIRITCIYFLESKMFFTPFSSSLMRLSLISQPYHFQDRRGYPENTISWHVHSTIQYMV